MRTQESKLVASRDAGGRIAQWYGTTIDIRARRGVVLATGSFAYNDDMVARYAPRIAGMPERYIADQLQLFKSGQRTSGLAAVMMPFASTLNAQDMRNVGAWFASQKPGAGIADDSVIASGPNTGLKFYQVGERMFRGGDAARGIPACMACHGPSGSGNPGPAYPALHGQSADYVTRRLEEYRTGTTTYANHAHFDLMASVAKTLTDEEIHSLASYVQGLHARTAEPAAAASAP